MNGLKKERIGEIKYNNRGLRMRIIEYRNTSDIDVIFDDGTVREHVSYGSFVRGTIAKQKYKKRKYVRVGDENAADNGLRMRITDIYRDSSDSRQYLEITFEDGVVVRGVTAQAFNKGKVINPKLEENTLKESLLEVFPLIANEWNYARNIDCTPETVFCGSGKKVWWKCKEGHEWECTVHNRTRNGTGCPYCSGRRAIPGKTDLVTLFPQLAEEWNYEKNPKDLQPENITSKSSKKIWWLGKCGHEWQATVNSRASGVGCPYCAGTRVLAGFNDLATAEPVLAAEWHPTKNGSLTPEHVSTGSIKKVWWLGKCGHEWEAVVSSRARGHGCPYCSGLRLLEGINDLQTINPELAQEWHPTKNGALTPTSISAGSEKKIWWLGKCGHEWQASPKSRNRGNGCPICAKRMQSSFPEQAIYYYLNKAFPDAKNRYTELGNNKMEIDIFIPSLSIGIEYDGKAFHNTEEAVQREVRKYEICRENGIKLIRVRELDIPEKEIGDIYIKSTHHPTFSDLDQTIAAVLETVDSEKQVDINVKRDEGEIKAQYYSILKDSSLLSARPDLAAEWHPTKNGILKPDMVAKAGNDKVWWLCANGHEWQAVVNSRYMGNGCPYCAGKKLLLGYNDLQTVKPALAAEWHPTKNGNLLPTMFLEKSGRKVWWKCKEGHEWEAAIRHRSNGSGCPYCWGRYATNGENDLKTVYPKIALLWHPTKNDGLLPSQVTKGSGKKIWWLGSCGHEWQRSVNTMVKTDACPYCSGREVLKGFNDLSTKRPEIADEWNYEKNNELTPDMFSEKSGKKVWWKCSNGHEWQARICDRSNGSGCPQCSRRKEC